MEGSNPYEDSTGMPKLKRSVFCFVDILGFSVLAKEKNTDVDLQCLHGALKANIDGLRVSAGNGAEVKTFTDNVVMGKPLLGRSDGEAELMRTCDELSHYQLDMVLAGYFVRGAISLGDAYIDDITVYGDSLIEAHDGEEKLARNPRIILTESASLAVPEHLKAYGEPDDSPTAYYLLQDADGQYFLNYLQALEDQEAGSLDESKLQLHKDMVESKLEEFKYEPKLFGKYSWVAQYHNYFCSSRGGLNSYLIDLKLFKPSMTTIV